jgi:hypothetical protein
VQQADEPKAPQARNTNLGLRIAVVAVCLAGLIWLVYHQSH